MTCRELVQFLMEYLDGELPEDSHRVFEAHLGECPPCKHYLDTYRDTVRMGQQVCCEGDDALPADVPEQLVKAVLAARDRE